MVVAIWEDRMLKPAILALAALLPATSAQPCSFAGPSLAKARAFAAQDGERLWPGYGTTSFGFLLLTNEEETLLCRAEIPDGFSAAGTDQVTGCRRFIRARTELPDGLLAAMPLFGPPAVIVMGTPQATGHTEASWTRAILHEHFHQWQYAHPGYYERTSALNLAGGDRTGMWMLNFPFPYERADLVKAEADASHALAKALAARWTPRFYAEFDAYIGRRRAFAEAAGVRNWRYIEIQLWQEGVARWTELTLGKAFPDAEVKKSAAELEARTLAALRSPDLAAQKREFVYAYGAGEAMLMDACGNGWRRRYPVAIGLGPLLSESRMNCGRNGH